jgi:hypothetical protein
VKLLTFIFAFYFLALPLLPCGDEIECNLSVQQMVVQSQNHSEHEHQTDLCSPFCICSCCSIAINLHHAKSLSIIPFGITQKFSERHFSFVSEFMRSVWQPPKIW